MSKKKVCRHCLFIKPADHFLRHSGRSDGLQSYCRICMNGMKQRARSKKKDAYNLRTRLYMYGIQPHEYAQLLAAQDGRCAGCGRIKSDDGRNLAIDHCHSTKRVRGLLCLGCNLALGYVGDDPKVLRNLAAYLERVSGKAEV